MLYRIEKRPLPLSAGKIHALSATPHIHPDLELIYLDQGSSIAHADYKEYLLEPGDLFLAFPNQVHYYLDQTSPRGLLFIFSPEQFKDLKEIFQNKIPKSPIVKKKDLPLDITVRLSLIHDRIVSDSSYDNISAKGYLLAFLCEVLTRMELVPYKGDHDSIKNILTYCSQNYTDQISLDSISRDLHLNKYYISHVFTERMHIRFTDFIISLRVEHACNLLEKDCSITEVAFSSGFSSIRTFNRVFADSMKMSPREYIRQQEEKVLGTGK